LTRLAEAVALGISSGPACLASCGPVLFPCLVAERQGGRATPAILARFLAGRFGGYVLFAGIAWSLGWPLERYPQARAGIFAAANLALSAALAWYARQLREPPVAACPAHCAKRLAAPAAVGLFTGLNLCPPFVAAAVRAAENPSLWYSLLFFSVFFLATAILFIPAVALGLFSRFAAAAAVARLTMFLLAGYYAYLGLVALLRISFHA
jgi:sulfite exporter TauE/SafE